MINHFSYRISTILNAISALRRLSPEKIKAFLDSYYVFDLDWSKQGYNDEIKKALSDYYSVLNNLCALAMVEKMYIPPALDLTQNLWVNQELFEEKMAQDLKIKSGDRVLDVGCGRGRVAAHMSSVTGGTITGINIDSVQLESARQFAKSNLRPQACQFLNADLNEIPFPFESEFFDQIYEIQALSYSSDLGLLFAELFRILKPGGRLACLDYVLKEAFDKNNTHHIDLLRRTKPLLGAIGSPLEKDFLEAMRKAGFKVLESRDVSLNERQTPLIQKAMGNWMSLPMKMGILPKHFQILVERFSLGADAFIEADQLGLLTTSWYFVAEKPAR